MNVDANIIAVLDAAAWILIFLYQERLVQRIREDLYHSQTCLILAFPFFFFLSIIIKSKMPS